MNNLPQFKVFGEERRALKKQLSELKCFVNSFWHFHTIDKDMADIIGRTENYPMSDVEAEKLYQKKLIEIEYLENKLSEPYK